MHLLVLLSLRTSKKVLTLKIKHIACGRVEAAYFPLPCALPQRVSIPLLSDAALQRGVEKSLFLLISGASPSYSAVTSCPRGSPVSSCSQGKNAITPQSFSVVTVMLQCQACRNIARYFFHKIACIDLKEGKKGRSESACLAFQIKPPTERQSSAARCSQTFYSLPASLLCYRGM